MTFLSLKPDLKRQQYFHEMSHTTKWPLKNSSQAIYPEQHRNHTDEPFFFFAAVIDLDNCQLLD